MKRVIVGAGLILAVNMTANADVIDDLQASYGGPAAGSFSAESGQVLWRQLGRDNRTCATCHGEDLRQPGRHVTTQKIIAPMAPTVNAERFKDAEKVEKWFLRNCKWTWGRECDAQEKGDLLQYLRGQ